MTNEKNTNVLDLIKTTCEQRTLDVELFMLPLGPLSSCLPLDSKTLYIEHDFYGRAGVVSFQGKHYSIPILPTQELPKNLFEMNAVNFFLFEGITERTTLRIPFLFLETIDMSAKDVPEWIQIDCKKFCKIMHRHQTGAAFSIEL